MIAGTMAVHTFPFDHICILKLVEHVDCIVIWLDGRAKNRREEIIRLIREHKDVNIIIVDATAPWGLYKSHVWREPMFRALDDIRPEIVLQPDSDEAFGEGFVDDLSLLRESGKDLLMFDFEMVTEDNTRVPKLPQAPHCKAFRWYPNMTFVPYRGYCKPCPEHLTEVTAKSKIQHYCFYTLELQRDKIANYPPEKKSRFCFRVPICE